MAVRSWRFKSSPAHAPGGWARARLVAMRTIVRGACPLDCPDTCSWLVEVEDGRAVGAARRPRAPVHARRALPQGQPLPRRSARPRPRDPPAAPRRRQGRGPLRAHRLGRGDRGGRGRPALGDRAPRPRVGAALLLRGHRGHGAGLDHGAAPVRGARRLAAADDDLHRRRRRRPARHLRRLGRHGSRRTSSTRGSSSCGARTCSPRTSTSGASCWRRSGAARTSSRSTRCAPTPPSAATSTSRRAPAPTRRSRSASCAPCSTRAPRTATGSRATREGWPELEARLAEWPVERAAEICGLPVEDVRALGRRLRAHAPHRDPPRPRAAAPRRRRRGDARDPRAARAHRRLPARRRRRAVHDGRPLRRHRRRPRAPCPPTCRRRRRARSTCRASARR